MKTIEIRTAAKHAGKWVGGVWAPAGSLIATMTFPDDTHPDTIREIVARLERPAPPVRGLPDEVAWEVEVSDAE